MNLIRPEVRDAITRWREAIAGVAVILAGLWLIGSGFSLRVWLGYVVVLVGGALLFAGIQRGRFRGKGGGLGMVEIDERQITYLGPFGGGAMAVEDIDEIGVDPARNWLLRDIGGQHLLVPLDAAGADSLFDAFSALPGLSGTQLIEAVQTKHDHYSVIWQRPSARLS